MRTQIKSHTYYEVTWKKYGFWTGFNFGFYNQNFFTVILFWNSNFCNK